MVRQDSRYNTVVRIVMFVVCPWAVHTANVLLLSAPTYKHCDKFGAIGASLLVLGHSVKAYIPYNFDFQECLQTRNISTIMYGQKTNGRIDLSTTAKKYGSRSVLDSVRKVRNTLCSNILNDADSFKQLQSEQFSLAIVDTAITADCYLLIPHRLKIPFVSMEYWHIWYGSGKPFIPHMETPTFYVNGKPTFLDRLQNTWFVLLRPYYYPWYLRVESELLFAPELNYFDYISLIKKSVLFIQDDDVLITGSQPLMPNTIQTGGFTVGLPRPLPPDIEAFYKTADKGVIVVSFGGLLEQMSDKILVILRQVFESTKQKVLLMSKTAIALPNVLTRTRIPQNDVLGHEKTKLLIADCGRNGVYEAIYHGVPVICLPHFMDQPTISMNIEARGMAIVLNPQTLNAEKLSDAILKIHSNQTFSKASKQMSLIYKDMHRKSAGDIAAHAIDHVIQYGGDHLRPASLDYSWVSFLLLDVWISVFSITFLLLLSLCCCYRVLQGAPTAAAVL